jgi:hypothetical protein
MDAFWLLLAIAVGGLILLFMSMKTTKKHNMKSK